jgi:hypothetical protein
MKHIWTIIGVRDGPASFKWYQLLFGQTESTLSNETSFSTPPFSSIIRRMMQGSATAADIHYVETFHALNRMRAQLGRPAYSLDEFVM